MEKQYQVTVKGTLQQNGPLTIKKTVILDQKQAGTFTGANRYEVIEAFLKIHYPGAKIPNIRNFGVEVKAL
ncbi:MAG: hypothetical protein RSA53_06325 [Odoribacter sp.]